MRLSPASLVLVLAARASAFSGNAPNGGGGGESSAHNVDNRNQNRVNPHAAQPNYHTPTPPAVSGSSATGGRLNDRYGNSNQLHGKHVHEYAYERMQQLGAPPPPTEQQQQQPKLKHKVNTGTGGGGPARVPVNKLDDRYGSATTAKPNAPKKAVITGPSPTTANRVGDRYANSAATTGPPPVSHPSAAARHIPVPPPGGYMQRQGYGGVPSFGSISGSSAQQIDDRYGNVNQLHGKHVHEYAYERMQPYSAPPPPPPPPPPADQPEGEGDASQQQMP